MEKGELGSVRILSLVFRATCNAWPLTGLMVHGSCKEPDCQMHLGGFWSLSTLIHPATTVAHTVDPLSPAAHQRERFIVLTRDSQAILLTCDQP